MEARAILRSARVAPRKARLVSDLIRGMSVSRALEVLEFVDKKPALIISKVISSAVANARDLGDADVDSLIVHTVFVDEGPMLKRFLPRAMGRATSIRKKTSHITVVVASS
jgi:large subunit ribosomal protein L22